MGRPPGLVSSNGDGVCYEIRDCGEDANGGGDHQAVYLIAIGGAAYLVSKAIKSARILAFADLGMEAIYEFEVVDMPVTVAVSADGASVHQTGPAEWQARIAATSPAPLSCNRPSRISRGPTVSSSQ
jgi:hypothetical protein